MQSLVTDDAEHMALKPIRPFNSEFPVELFP